jgi:hypothetical protein
LRAAPYKNNPGGFHIHPLFLSIYKMTGECLLVIFISIFIFLSAFPQFSPEDVEKSRALCYIGCKKEMSENG